MFADIDEKLLHLFMNVLWLALQNIPLWKAPFLVELCEWHEIPLGENYINNVMARDMMESLAFSVLDRLNKKGEASPHVGLMCDESTDVSRNNSMALYIRHLDDGVFKTSFWGLVQAQDASAEGLLSVIQRNCEENGVSIDKIISFAADGAFVMTGRDNGVAVRLQKLYPFMLTAHCVAHKEALAAGDAAKENDVCDFMETSLPQVITYHSHSTKRKDHLTKLQEQLQVDQLRALKMVATRWLSRGAATERVFNIIPGSLKSFTKMRTDLEVLLAKKPW